jgi:hypothetical protein
MPAVDERGEEGPGEEDGHADTASPRHSTLLDSHATQKSAVLLA